MKCVEHLQLGKLKVKLSLGLVKYHAVKTYADVEIKLQSYTSHPFTPEKTDSDTNAQEGGLVPEPFCIL
jgi:hypothetical protein